MPPAQNLWQQLEHFYQFYKQHCCATNLGSNSRTCSFWVFDEQSSCQASIDQKLKEAEERKKSIETERLVYYDSIISHYLSLNCLHFFKKLDLRIKNLSSQLAKIDIAQHKKEETEKAKV